MINSFSNLEGFPKVWYKLRIAEDSHNSDLLRQLIIPNSFPLSKVRSQSKRSGFYELKYAI